MPYRGVLVQMAVLVLCVTAIRGSPGPQQRQAVRSSWLIAADKMDKTDKMDGAEDARTATSVSPPPPPMKAILHKAAKRAIGGGLSGWVAGVVQVTFLMWLRTAMK